jgi:hypothetical protein
MSSPTEAPTELDEAQIVRAERFILPDVSGITVPCRFPKDGRVVTEWRLLLRWNDGRREESFLGDCINAGGRNVYLQPRPPAPEPNQVGRWSADGRRKWRDGNQSMPADELYKRLVDGFARYLHLPSEDDGGVVLLLTCWTILTYVYPVFDAIPYLAIGGPTGSGKTRVLDLLEQLVFRPISTSNLTNSVLFRHLDAFGGTALLDEAERFHNVRSPETGELMSSLLAGYRRGKCISKSESLGDGRFAPRHYCVSGPKAVACINSLPAPLASRSVSISMLRCPTGSPKPRLRVAADAAEWSLLRDALHATAMEHGPDWLTLPSRQHVCPEMSGRNYELWQPLLAIAAWLEEQGVKNLLTRLQSFALRSVRDSRETTTPPEDEVLLQSLAALLASGKRPTAQQVLSAAEAKESNLFHRWSPKRASATLNRYGFKARPSHGQHVYDPTDDSLRRVQDCYGIDLGLPQLVDAQAQPLSQDGAHGAHAGPEV